MGFGGMFFITMKKGDFVDLNSGNEVSLIVYRGRQSGEKSDKKLIVLPLKISKWSHLYFGMLKVGDLKLKFILKRGGVHG